MEKRLDQTYPQNGRKSKTKAFTHFRRGYRVPTPDYKMGSVFSRPPAEPQPPSNLPRKRSFSEVKGDFNKVTKQAFSANGSKSEQNLAATETEGAANPRHGAEALHEDSDSPSNVRDNPNALLDNTPDGTTYKYMIKCDSMGWCNKRDVLKMLSKLDMPPHNGVHKMVKWRYFFVTFPNDKCAEVGVCVLKDNSYRNKPWIVSRVAEHSAKRRRINAVIDKMDANNSDDKGGAEEEPVPKTAALVTAKWSKFDYDGQVSRKRLKLLGSLRIVTKKLFQELKDPSRLPWLPDVVQKPPGQKRSFLSCCPLENIIEATEENERIHYRNKTEFTIGMSPASCGTGHLYHKSELTIGYMLGMVRNGVVSVGAVDETCVTTSKRALGIAKCLTETIRQLKMPHYDKREHTGYWRQVMIREGVRTGQVIVTMMVHLPPAYKTTANPENGFYIGKEDERCRAAVVRALRDRFESSSELGVFWQVSDEMCAISSAVTAVHLHGIKSLYEEMCGLRFRIQPTAFFQVNTPMAEKLYKKIGDLARVDKETVVLDICCGTGTIGLSLANRAHSVIGIELNASAVEDAKYNAKLNNITNASFIAGKVEDYIYSAVKQISKDKPCVVVLDPPRAGLHNNVIAAIRALRCVTRVVYVACEPKHFWKNAIALCKPRSKTFRQEPFKPTVACGVDLFPQTDRAELVVLLERERVLDASRAETDERS